MRKDNDNQLRFLFSGMGWNIFDEFDKLTYVHDGGTDGFKSYLMLIPEEQYGVVILTNSRSHNFAQAIADELQYALMEMPFQNFSETYREEYLEDEKIDTKDQIELNQLIEKHSKESLEITQYLGTYSNQLYGEMAIVKSKDGLQLKLLQHKNKLTGNLKNIGNHNFGVLFSLPEFSSTKIEFIFKDHKIIGFTYFADTSGDNNYFFTKRN